MLCVGRSRLPTTLAKRPLPGRFGYRHWLIRLLYIAFFYRHFAAPKNGGDEIILKIVLTLKIRTEALVDFVRYVKLSARSNSELIF